MNLPQHSETIVAPATPLGRGGVGVIRVSGPLAYFIFEKITQKTELEARKATFSTFYDRNHSPIDMGLVLYFPAPHSFTGEEVIEFQGHGGPVIMDLLVSEILFYGARLARPGEFSERAFLNDKMDLTQAEAIADLIDAASSQAARLAFSSLQGTFSQTINHLVDQLIYLRTYVEAAIDFPDEEVDFLGDGVVIRLLNDLIQQLDSIFIQAKQGSRLREGLTVVIVGKPNAGKSSLLNQLSGRETAIVTEIPGTTRDLIREQILLEGIPLHIVDTAGLRETQDPVEQEGVKRARTQIAHSDWVILLLDMTHLTWPLSEKNIQELRETYGLNELTPLTWVFNKQDLCPETQAYFQRNVSLDSYCFISAKTGEGIDSLRRCLKKALDLNTHEEGQFLARRRHLNLLEKVYHLLLEAKATFLRAPRGELLAEDLRYAQNHLQEITGEFTADDLLGEIFSSFCIGK